VAHLQDRKDVRGGEIDHPAQARAGHAEPAVALLERDQRRRGVDAGPMVGLSPAIGA